jgi:hypothetical protein
MPLFVEPPLLNTSHKLIDQAMVCVDKPVIQNLKKAILVGVLTSKEGRVLVKLGTCNPDGESFHCKLSQEDLNKLKSELGQLAIATKIITSKMTVYLFATNR